MLLDVTPQVKLTASLEPRKEPNCICEVKYVKEREMLRAIKKLESIEKFNGQAMSVR